MSQFRRDADAPHRPAGEALPRARGSRCTRASPRSLGSPTATGRRRDPPRRGHAPRDGRDDDPPDTVFIPYHWGLAKSANRLTVAAQDPISKIPSTRSAAAASDRPTPARNFRAPGKVHARCPSPPPRVLRRPEPLHRVPGLRAGVQRVRHAPGRPMIHLEYRRPARRRRRSPSFACTASSPTCAEVCPADAIKRTGDGVVQSARKPRCIACGNCVVACPFGSPKLYIDRAIMMKCDMCYDRTSVGRTDVRDGLSEPGAVLRHARADLALRPQSMPTNTFSVRRPADPHAGSA